MTPPGRSFFSPGEGEALGLWPGDGLTCGLGLGDALGVSSGSGEGVTLGEGLVEAFFFLLLFDDGEGEAFGVGDRAGDAAGVGEFAGFGEGLDFGVALGEAFGRGEGVGVAELFFLDPLELFRFFGGGVGSKMPLILSPNDCASACGAVKPNATALASAPTSNSLATRSFNARVPAGSLCSAECPRRSSRAGSSR